MNDFYDTHKTLRAGELATLRLRALYERYGYRKFSMGKFEEYDFYAQNKDFLQNNRLLTFTGASGRLMALRPDVTMSIVKKTKAGLHGCEKLYYTENVYRAEKDTAEFRESSQIGVEHIGEVTAHTNAELTSLILKSLGVIQNENMLDISHMGFLGGLLNECGADAVLRKRLRACVEGKNPHELRSALGGGPLEKYADIFLRIMNLPEDFALALDAADILCVNEEMKSALSEIRSLYKTMDALGMAGKMNLDFSLASDEAYYNGIVFRGYVKGVPKAVLSGGRYDLLLDKMGKTGVQAIGFAIYFDELERYLNASADNVIDTVVVYSPESDPAFVCETVSALIENGESVWTGLREPEGMVWKRLIRIDANSRKEEI